MSFTECARIAERHPDLAEPIQKISTQLQKMGTAEIIRPNDLASYLDLDLNQVQAVLSELARTGFLRAEDMVECSHCGVPVLRSEYDEAYEEDGEYCCTCCDRPLGAGTIQAVTTYRRGDKWPEISGGSNIAELPGNSSPVVPPNNSLEEDAYYTYVVLAERHGLAKDALRKKLDRYREKNLNGGWKQNEDRRPREPKHLYKLKDVKHILDEMKASSERPAK